MKKGSKMPPEARAKISTSLVGNSYRRGIPHDEETKARVSVALKRAYIEERHRLCPNPRNLAAYNLAIKNGYILHPCRKPDRDAAIAISHLRTRSLKATAEEFGLTPEGAAYAIRRANPAQLPKRKGNYHRGKKQSYIGP